MLLRSNGSELSKTGSMRRPRPRNCQTPSGEVGKPARLLGSPEIMGAADREGEQYSALSIHPCRERFPSLLPFLFGRFLHSPMYFTPAAAGTRKVTQEVGVRRRRFSDTVCGVNQTMIISATFSSCCLPKFHLFFPCFHKNMIQIGNETGYHV